MVKCSPLLLTEYPGLKSAFANLPRSDLFIQLEEYLLFFMRSVLKTSNLLIDERLPGLYLEKLEMHRETVELMTFYHQTSCHRLENSCLSCSSSNVVFLNCIDYLYLFASSLRSYTVVVQMKG